MQPSGSVICFLCKGHVPYTRNNIAKFERHMKTDHSVFFGVDYLLAGCLMSNDERLAVTDVVKEKEKENEITNETPRVSRRNGGRSANITLEEGEVNSQFDFNTENSANEDVDPLANVSVSSVSSLSTRPVSVKLERASQRTLENPAIVKLSKKQKKLQKRLQKNLKAEKLIQRKKYSTPRQRPEIPEGEGFPCTDCGNVYKTEAMQKFHYTDVHVQGHFPCKGGCGKIFTSKNKMSSHWSRHCNDKSKKRVSI